MTGFRYPPEGGMYPSTSESDELWAMLGYMGGIFLGPFAPLGIFIAKRRVEFVRRHAAQALNLTLTCTIYAFCLAIVGGLMSFDSTGAALAVSLPIAVAGWLSMLTQLVRGAIAASRGGYREFPRWICALMVS